MLRIRRKEDIVGKRLNVGGGAELETVHLGAPDGAVQGEREILPAFHCSLFFAGPAGQLRAPGDIALWF